MGNPVSTVMANLVMEHVEKRIFSTDNNIRFWKRFVDDVWVLLPKSKINETLELINSVEPSIKFTLENENNNSLPFLDVKVTRLDGGSFISEVYYKPTHTGRYLDFNSNHPLAHKRSVVRSLMDRAVLFSSKNDAKNVEINRIRSTLSLNNYPNYLLNNSNSRNRNMLNTPLNTYSKRVVLPYVKGCSERLSRVLRKYDVGVSFKPINKLHSIFGRQKDPVEPDQVCGVVYEIPCSDCDRTYIGQTGNSLRTRLQQHRAACRHLQKEKSALAEHSINNDHRINWAEAKVIARQDRWHRRLFEEAFVTNQRHAPLNRCELPLPPVYKKLL